MTSLPSYADYGTYDESAHPDLWDGVVGYWAPCLGPTGLRLHDVSRWNNWGTLTNMDAASDWGVDGGQYVLDFDGSNDYVATSFLPQFRARDFSIHIAFIASDVTAKCIFGTINTGTSTVLQINMNSTFIGASSVGKVAFQLRSTTGLRRYVDAGTGLNDGKPHTIVCVRRDATTEIHIDGKEATLSGDTATSISGSLYDTEFPVTIGARNLRGVIDLFTPARCSDIVVWDRAVSPNEIYWMHNIGRGGMLQRRTRRRAYSVQAGFRAHYATQRNAQLIGGGLR
jgi:hypothetical protein